MAHFSCRRPQVVAGNNLGALTGQLGCRETAKGVDAGQSLDGKDKHRLLWDWMVALEQSMASEGGPAIPNPLALGYSEHEHLGG